MPYEAAIADLPRPEGKGLNDLYVRFFRVAERRIIGSPSVTGNQPPRGGGVLNFQFVMVGRLLPTRL
jgi:hypothetical protein